MILIPKFALCTLLAMIVHELGHLFAARKCGVATSEIGLGIGPRLWTVRGGSLAFSIRAIPLASFARLDGVALEALALQQRLLVHLGGIILNLLAAAATYGTIFGWVNLLLAGANLLPIYKHDGWKCGVAIMRALLRKKSQPVEWAFTFSGGFASLAIVSAVLHLFHG
jgi:membrane-associated protease RseP (regulator of RpoE activity)